MNINYQKELDGIIEENTLKGRIPTLLLHACCAPCSSYCLEYLSKYFKITVLYYNPNISAKDEYDRRVEELRRLTGEMPFENPVEVIYDRYEPSEFYEAVKGLEHVHEGGERCFKCYELRLREAAEVASRMGFDYFTTTLTISPLKNSAKLNEIGQMLGEEYHVTHLPSDFKKRDGYKRSTVLSKEYGLYRQDYCGCVFSKEERRLDKLAKEAEASVQPSEA